MIELPKKFKSEYETHKYLKKFKKSWEKRFKLTRMKELYESVDLSNYLVALGRETEARDLLKEITSQIEFAGNYNIWSPTGAGVILLSRLLRLEQSNEYLPTIERIAENDFYNVRRKKEYYESTILNQEKVLEEIETETQKWSCHILSRHLIDLNYQMETAQKRFQDTENFDLALLETYIQEAYKFLEEKLK